MRRQLCLAAAAARRTVQFRPCVDDDAAVLTCTDMYTPVCMHTLMLYVCICHPNAALTDGLLLDILRDFVRRYLRVDIECLDKTLSKHQVV